MIGEYADLEVVDERGQAEVAQPTSVPLKAVPAVTGGEQGLGPRGGTPPQKAPEALSMAAGAGAAGPVDPKSKRLSALFGSSKPKQAEFINRLEQQLVQIADEQQGVRPSSKWMANRKMREP